MTRLSERQFKMLQTFADGGADFWLSLEDAAGYDQRPFRSMLMRQYVTYRAGKGFKMTKTGAKAWSDFLSCNITRKDPTGALTSYFDPEYYALRSSKAAGRMELRA
ncbi:MAG TPA: hypothetical protein VF077_06200 [Nitrospiraceae bacterium]